MCSQTKAPGSHIDLILAGSIQEVSFLILIFATYGTPEVIVSMNFTQFSSARYENFCRGLKSPFLTFRLISMV
ncbi:hypothetical protein ACTXT7_007959 [Hymenolepis weldensis]